MSHAGWGDVWSLALARWGSEPIEIRILIGLAIAFIALMVVEGLRASFLPAKTKIRPAEIVAPPKKAVVKKAAGSETRAYAPSSNVIPFRPVAANRIPKPAKTSASRHRPERPKIRRAVSSGHAFLPSPAALTEESAPFSPLPNKQARVEL